jgi:hypothetical protein
MLTEMIGLESDGMNYEERAELQVLGIFIKKERIRQMELAGGCLLSGYQLLVILAWLTVCRAALSTHL